LLEGVQGKEADARYFIGERSEHPPRQGLRVEVTRMLHGVEGVDTGLRKRVCEEAVEDRER
jgi:hypothetical protein